MTDLFTHFPDYDEAILVSGDGDFTDTVQQLMKRGKKVRVVSMRNRLAQELRECGAQIVYLEDILQLGWLGGVMISFRRRILCRVLVNRQQIDSSGNCWSN